jgi:hypothetical protein
VYIGSSLGCCQATLTIGTYRVSTVIVLSVLALLFRLVLCMVWISLYGTQACYYMKCNDMGVH